VLLAPEPRPPGAINAGIDAGIDPSRRARAWLGRAVVGPVADFVRRHGWRAVTLLALIATFRMADIVMGVMANPFYHDLGFTKDEVAAVSKVFGVLMTLAGAFIGGAVAPRIGILPTLFGGAAGAVASNLLYALLALRGHDLGLLVLAISADNIAAGVAGSAFIAFMSGLTNIRYSASQYALLSSMMLLLPKYLAGYGGVFVDRFGYARFFCTTAALGIPALLLVWLVARQSAARPRPSKR
jgi:PAT family beta-lactamase induction signal transducer AmpG